MTKRRRTTSKSSMGQQVRDLAKDPLASRESARRSGQKADYGSSGERKKGRPSGSKNKPKSEVKTFTKQQRNKATAVHRGITQGIKGQTSRVMASQESENRVDTGRSTQRTGPKISKIRKAFARVPLAAFRLGGGGGGGAGRK